MSTWHRFDGRKTTYENPARPTSLWRSPDGVVHEAERVYPYISTASLLRVDGRIVGEVHLILAGWERLLWVAAMGPGHVTRWPGCEQHSGNGRPNIYRGRDGWWVDDSGVNPDSDSDDWDQSLFPTWPEALAYALDMVDRARRAHEAASAPNGLIDERDPACVERWPGCADFEYNPACCRFPKSCSAGTIRVAR